MTANGEINMAHIRVGGGAIGLVFAVGTVYVFAEGIPALRVFLVGAGVLGLVISVGVGLFHKYRPARIVTPFSN